MSGSPADRQARWVAMWREAVRASHEAMAVADLSTTRFVELSPKAAELFGTTPERGAGLEYLSLAERPQEAADTFRLARDGMLDGIKARRRLRRPDGPVVEVESWGWVIRSPAGRDLGLWVAREVRSATEHVPVVAQDQQEKTRAREHDAGKRLHRGGDQTEGHTRNEHEHGREHHESREHRVERPRLTP